MSTRLLWILAIALLHGSAWQLLLPPWMGEDEPWQYEYAHQIARGHAPHRSRVDAQGAPILGGDSQAQLRRALHGLDAKDAAAAQASILNEVMGHRFRERVDWSPQLPAPRRFDEIAPAFTAAKQPPTYFVAMSFVLRLVPEWDHTSRLRLLRGVSLLLVLLTVALAFDAARHAFDDERRAALAALLVAMWPMHARQSAVVNNDLLANLWVALGLALMARFLCRRRPVTLALAAGVTVAGLWIKMTCLALVPPLLVCAALAAPARLRQKGARGPGLVLALLVGAGLVALLFSGFFPGVPLRPEVMRERVLTGLTPANLRAFAETWVGSFNWESRPLPGAVVALGVALFAPALLVLTPRGSRLTRAHAGMFAVCVLGLALLILVRGESRGRYLQPVLPALAVLTIDGWLRCGRQYLALPVVRRNAFAWILFAVSGVALWRGLVVHQWLVWGV